MEFKAREQASWDGVRLLNRPARSLGPVNAAAYIAVALGTAWLLGLGAAALGIAQSAQRSAHPGPWPTAREAGTLRTQ